MSGPEKASLEAIVWARKARGITPLAWRILNMLASRVNDERADFLVWPSHKLIAEDCDIASVTTVKRYLKELVDRGYLTVIPNTRADGGKTSNIYQLPVKLTITTPDDVIEVDAGYALATGVAGGIATCVPMHRNDSIRNDSIEQEPSLSARDLFGNPIESEKLADSAVVSMFMASWLVLCAEHPVYPKVRGALSEDRRKAIVERIDEFATERTEAAVCEIGKELFEKLAASKFLQGENDRGFVPGIDWILKPKNFRKTLEGNYDERGSTSGKSAGANRGGRSFVAAGLEARDILLAQYGE